ncbi:unnamed protein product [Paramecium sonneborni]|uniref:non-specific serine/threonine protein kinase n=1 Tax=Paramecium sonneborni TaxID=65129 RepID=A0A8S1LLY1_9CILI|nr:unnamed protein product [Paramecium sonneborni]
MGCCSFKCYKEETVLTIEERQLDQIEIVISNQNGPNATTKILFQDKETTGIKSSSLSKEQIYQNDLEQQQDQTKNKEGNNSEMIKKTINGTMKLTPEMLVRKQCITEKFLSHYEIIKKLGQGGFGEVYLVKHLSTKNLRAAKVILRKTINCEETLLEETEILKTLDHPNIVKVLEIFADFKYYYIITEYCKGGELLDRIKTITNYSERIAAKYMKQVFSAIMYCHNKNIVHRDLKPENILFDSKDPEANLKVIDFGASEKMVNESNLTKKVGTPYYVAPEVISEPEYDKKVDVWSCGVILYILMIGRPPFRGQNDIETLRLAKLGKFNTNHERWNRLSNQVKDLIIKMIVVDPKQRINIEEAFQHDWIQNNQNNGIQDYNIIKTLSQFTAQNKLRAAIIQFISVQLVNKEESVKLSQTFKSLDINGDGTLSKEELLKGILTADIDHFQAETMMQMNLVKLILLNFYRLLLYFNKKQLLIIYKMLSKCLILMEMVQLVKMNQKIFLEEQKLIIKHGKIFQINLILIKMELLKNKNLLNFWKIFNYEYHLIFLYLFLILLFFMQPNFEECHEKKLKKYRQKFETMLYGYQTERKSFFNNYIDKEPKTCNQSPNQTKMEKNQFSLSICNPQTQRSSIRCSVNKNQQVNRRIVQKQTQQVISTNKSLNYEFSFPKWISERSDFQKWKSHSDFDINLKIVSICKMETFKRDQAQKQIVALYLQKLSLFKLMPLVLLQELAGRLTYKQIRSESDLTLCKIGEIGNCMYIIFQGTVKVIIKDICVKEFHDNEHLGRQALETDAPRNATLICTQNSHILILSRWDYQQCLNNLFKIERPKWINFINSIHFFRNFSSQKIQRLCEDLKGKFMSAKDCLYKIGDQIDNFYIVKSGVLVKKVVVNLEKSNRWPVKTKVWLQNTVATRQEITIKYESQSLLGYYEIVTQETLGLKYRTEEINAFEDCFLLFIPRIKFQDIFDLDDQKQFQELFLKLYPTTFDQLIKMVKEQDQKKKLEFKTIKDALIEGLQNADQIKLQKKTKKYKEILLNAKNRLKQYQQTKGIIQTEIRQKVMNSIYE